MVQRLALVLGVLPGLAELRGKLFFLATQVPDRSPCEGKLMLCVSQLAALIVDFASKLDELLLSGSDGFVCRTGSDARGLDALRQGGSDLDIGVGAAGVDPGRKVLEWEKRTGRLGRSVKIRRLDGRGVAFGQMLSEPLRYTS